MNTNTSIIRSLLDTDFYKFTMGQFIHRMYAGTEVLFELINRDASVPLADIIPEESLRRELDRARSLHLSEEEVNFLRNTKAYGGHLFSENYLSFLKEKFSLPPYVLEKRGSQYHLSFTGPWEIVTFWETIALSIVSELYNRSLLNTLSEKERLAVYETARERVEKKLDTLAEIHELRFADFGQRRRHSASWQKEVLALCRKKASAQFIGTSNVLLAKEMSLSPIGTNAHELPMVLTALAGNRKKRDAQYLTTTLWEALYGKDHPGLLTLLPDTYGTCQFLRRAPRKVAKKWGGLRQDSGDPVRIAETYISWLRTNGVNPKEKLIIFSDGIDVDTMRELHKRFIRDIGVAFGWGTLLTNDFAGICPDIPLLRPFSVVCKVTEANRRPAVKLSDNIRKATGPLFEQERYLTIFGRSDREQIRVVV